MGNTLALPLRLTSSGAFGSLDQDDPAEVSQSVALLLATRPGERRSVPEYGLPDPLFSGVDLAVVAAVVATWEDRADDVTLEQVVAGASQAVTLTHATAPVAPAAAAQAAAAQPTSPPTAPPTTTPTTPPAGTSPSTSRMTADPDRPGFFLPAGQLTEDQAHPGYFLPLNSVTVRQDPDRPGFYDLNTTGAA